MDMPQKQVFRNTCFGHFMDIQPFVIQSQLLHLLIMRIVEHPNNKELWFDINGQKIKFSVNEFALITGLKCVGDDRSHLYTSGVSNNLKEQFFAGKDKVSRQAIKDVFNNYTGTSEEEIVKLGLLYLISNFCFSKAPKKTFSDNDLMIIDSPKFEEYPWGSFSYDMTLAYLRTASNYLVRKQQTEPTGNMSYKFYGFPWAFQVWAYECVKLAAEYCAIQHDRKAIQMFNWSYDSHPTSMSIKINVFNNFEVRVSTIYCFSII